MWSWTNNGPPLLASTEISMWPSSSDDDVRHREYSVKDVVMDEQWAAAVGIRW
jgi:hypothetical protein